MANSIPRNVQVITDDLDYNKGFGDYLKKTDLNKQGLDYRCVAVIGCQSSGKSTLLNLLFETNFEVMDTDEGRQQTTKGIWMAKNHDNKILVFDIEGTDSKERGEQRMTFEQTTSLFALAIADVLLINMWTTDVGRYGASNYGLLKVIFEVNLKLFEQQAAKKLLFVLRDFDDRGGNYEKITKIILGDVQKIWSEIYKPDAHKDKTPEDFFKFEFAMMPHKIYQEDQFIEKAKDLKNRFVVGAENSLFLEDAEQKNLPMDALPVYIDQSWDTIKNQKELNLPDQREMVANYRCQELKEEAYAVVKADVEMLQAKSDSGLVEGFNVECEKIMKTAVDLFSDAAGHYDKKVYNKILAELREHIISLLYLCFDSQLKVARQSTYNKVVSEIKKLEAKDLDSIVDNLAKIMDALLEANLKSFNKKSESLVFEGSGWEPKVELHKSDLKSQLETLANNCKEKILGKLAQLSQKEQEAHAKDFLHDKVQNLSESLAGEMRDAYVETIENFNGDMKNVLKNGFGMDVDDVYDFLNDSEGNTFDYVIQELRQVFRSSVNTNLLRKFNEGFKKDDDGKGRNWTEIEENSIKELHDGCKVRVEALLDEFKKIVFPKNVTRLDNIEEDTEEGDTPDGTFDLSRAVTSITEGAPKRTMSISNNRILSEEEVARVREKFYEDIDFVYEEAIARHRNVSNNNVPTWLWVVLIWFASDNIIGWFSSPILFYPLVLIIGVLFMAFQLGLMPILMDIGLPVVRTNVNTILAKTPLGIRI